MKSTLLALIFFLIPGIALAQNVVDILKIAGKSKAEVGSYLGKPTSCGNSKYGEKCTYVKGETEIVFIKGKADWITVEGIDHIPFASSALTAIGLKEQRPSFQNDFTLRWQGIQGLMEVSIFKGSSSADYAYIKVATR